MSHLADLLSRWDAAVLAEHGDAPLPDPVATAGSTLRTPATEADVAALEGRIGAALPPSYRAFLLTSNGMYAAPSFGSVEDPAWSLAAEAGLLTTAQVGWLRDRDPELIDIWLADEYEVPGAEEYVASDGAEVPRHLEVLHMPHLLQVSTCIDGYVTLLNPLVVDAAGEWEAWDFGSKVPGANRFDSFASLLRHRVEETEARATAPAPTGPGQSELDAAFAHLLSGGFEPSASEALQLVRNAPDPTYRFEDLVTLTGEPFHPWVRQAALASLARAPGTRALETILAATSGEPPIQVVAVTIQRLAADPDPRGRAEALRLLGHGDAANFVAHEATDLLWEGWQATGNLACVRELARRYDARAVAPMREALADPATDPVLRGGLVNVVGHVRDASLVPAVVAAAGFGVLTNHAVRALMELEAWDEALALITPERLGDPAQVPYLLEESLVQIARTGHAGAAARVVEMFATNPTAAGAKLLGQLVVPQAVAQLEAAAATKRLAKSCVTALERSAADGALAALERLDSPGHPARAYAADALSRRRRAPG